MNFANSNIKNFSTLRKVTLWAGGLGVIQSITWIALTITGIFAYNCFINLSPTVTFGSIVEYVFFKLYFQGNCEPDVYQSFNYTMLDTVDRALDPKQVLIWTSVYLAVSVCWLFSSVLLLTHVRKNNVMTTAVVLYTWVILTFCISALDLAQGVIFGHDYGQFHSKAHGFNLDSGQSGDIDPNASMLIAGQIAAISLMIISLKGFVLWIINVNLLIYLCAKAIQIMADKDGNDTLFMPRKDSDDILTTRPPINAFENGKSHISYNNDAFVPDNQSTGTIELNQEAIARAARMSTDASLQDRRFRNLDNFQQFPPPRSLNHNNHNNNNNRPVSPNSTTGTAAVATAPFPKPDYSPPMTRHNQPAQNAMLRNQRY